MASVLRVKVKDASVMVRVKCLAILEWLITLPTRSAILSLPRSARLARPVAAAMGVSSFSVAANRSWRLRARLSARAGLWQHTSRSPGNSGELISNRSWVSNSDSCSAPSSTNALICGARNALIQSSCPGAHLVADAGVGEHAPIPDQTHPGQPEPGFDLGDLGGQGVGVGGVALEHLDRDRDPGGRA